MSGAGDDSRDFWVVNTVSLLLRRCQRSADGLMPVVVLGLLMLKPSMRATCAGSSTNCPMTSSSSGPNAVDTGSLPGSSGRDGISGNDGNLGRGGRGLFNGDTGAVVKVDGEAADALPLKPDLRAEPGEPCLKSFQSTGDRSR